MSVLPDYNEIKELIKKGATLEAQEKIMELREFIVELQQENISLKNDNKALKEELEIKGKMDFDGSVYWLKDNSEGSVDKDGPFCPACFDKDQTSIRLQHIKGDEYIEAYRSCNVCKSNYYG